MFVKNSSLFLIASAIFLSFLVFVSTGSFSKTNEACKIPDGASSVQKLILSNQCKILKRLDEIEDKLGEKASKRMSSLEMDDARRSSFTVGMPINDACTLIGNSADCTIIKKWGFLLAEDPDDSDSTCTIDDGIACMEREVWSILTQKYKVRYKGKVKATPYQLDESSLVYDEGFSVGSSYELHGIQPSINSLGTGTKY